MTTVSEELARLAQLRNDGILTEDEFQAQKAAALARGTDAGSGEVKTAPATKNKAAAKGCGILVLVLIVLGVIGALAGGESETASSTNEAAAVAEAPIAVTAVELFNAYDANEAAAQQTYGNRRLLVSGTVAGVDLGIGDVPHVLLRTSNEFQNAQAALTDASQPKASTLTKGQPIRMECASVREIVGTPMLQNCDIR